MRRIKWIVGLAALSSLSFLTACIVSETRHTLYLSPDGGVDWVVRQTDVRASGKDPDKRAVEEREYLEAARVAAHPPAAALESLGASRVRTRILRAERPFEIETTARFSAVDALFERFFGAVEVESRVTFERVAGGRRLVLHLSGIELDEADESEEDDDPVFDLIDGDLRLVLTRGRFVAVEGFAATDHEDTVILSWEALGDLVQADGRATLSLEWSLD